MSKQVEYGVFMPVGEGAAVDDDGVGPRPARPHDPAASALCRKRGEGSLGHRLGARHGRRPPRCASGWQQPGEGIVKLLTILPSP